MTDADKVSFKILLIEKNFEPEFRRFVTDKNVETTLARFRENVGAIFNDRVGVDDGVDLKVTWTDDDGDKISVTRDDDLIIALTEMAARVKKFSVEILGRTDRPKSGKEPVVAWNVTCDGCDETIAGFRYKCVTCPDFDLCVGCEMKCVHPHHYMIRIPNPEAAWDQGYSWRLLPTEENVDDAASVASSEAAPELEPEPESEPEPERPPRRRDGSPELRRRRESSSSEEESTRAGEESFVTAVDETLLEAVEENDTSVRFVVGEHEGELEVERDGAQELEQEHVKEQEQEMDRGQEKVPDQEDEPEQEDEDEDKLSSFVMVESGSFGTPAATSADQAAVDSPDTPRLPQDLDAVNPHSADDSLEVSSGPSSLNVVLVPDALDGSACNEAGRQGIDSLPAEDTARDEEEGRRSSIASSSSASSTSSLEEPDLNTTFIADEVFEASESNNNSNNNNQIVEKKCDSSRIKSSQGLNDLNNCDQDKEPNPGSTENPVPQLLIGSEAVHSENLVPHLQVDHLADFDHLLPDEAPPEYHEGDKISGACTEKYRRKSETSRKSLHEQETEAEVKKFRWFRKAPKSVRPKSLEIPDDIDRKASFRRADSALYPSLPSYDEAHHVILGREEKVERETRRSTAESLLSDTSDDEAMVDGDDEKSSNVEQSPGFADLQQDAKRSKEAQEKSPKGQRNVEQSRPVRDKGPAMVFTLRDDKRSTRSEPEKRSKSKTDSKRLTIFGGRRPKPENKSEKKIQKPERKLEKERRRTGPRDGGPGPTPDPPRAQAHEPAAETMPDRKILDAVEKLVDMGFSNEGGCLALLVEEKRGNISRVLDVLIHRGNASNPDQS